MTASKSSLVAGILLSALLLAAFLLRLSRPGSDAVTPPRSPDASPGAARPKVPPAALPGAPAPPSAVAEIDPERGGNLELFQAVQERQLRAFEAALKKGGLDAAYLWVLEQLREEPRDLEGRVARAYALRFLPHIAIESPARRAEVVGLLRRHLTGDADAYGRQLALATLLDRPTLFSQSDSDRGVWFSDTNKRISEGSRRLDARALGIRLEADVELRAELRTALSKEPDWNNRQLLVRTLRAEPDPADLEVLGRTARNDSDKTVRYWALSALGKFPLSDETRDVYLQTMGTDPAPSLRSAAAVKLVDLGYADARVVDCLLGHPEQPPDVVQALGNAYALTKSPLILASLRQSIESPSPEVRLGVLPALETGKVTEMIPFLEARLSRENDPAVHRALAAMLETLRKGR